MFCSGKSYSLIKSLIDFCIDFCEALMELNKALIPNLEIHAV